MGILDAPLSSKSIASAINNSISGKPATTALSLGLVNTDGGVLRLRRSGLHQVANNCVICTQGTTGNNQVMAISTHNIYGAHTFLLVEYPAWVVQGNIEQANTGSSNFSAAISYSGTIYPVIFDFDNAYGGVTNGNNILGYCAITVPDGAQIQVRSYYGNGFQIWYGALQNVAAGEVMTFGNSGTVRDYTLGGTVLQSAGAFTFKPIRILGVPVAGKKSVFLTGDSIMYGLDEVPDATLDLGIAARSIGPTTPYTNAGSSGDALNVLFLTPGNSTKRFAHLEVYTHVISNFGNNDITSQTAAQMQANLLILWKLVGGNGIRPVWQCTFTPRTTSTDNFATIANQTVTAGWGPGAVQFTCNAWLNAGAPIIAGVAVAPGTSGALLAGSAGHPLTGVIDVNSLVMDNISNGKWKVDGTANKYTVDGTHLSNFTELMIAASGIYAPFLAS